MRIGESPCRIDTAFIAIYGANQGLDYPPDDFEVQYIGFHSVNDQGRASDPGLGRPQIERCDRVTPPPRLAVLRRHGDAVEDNPRPGA